MANKILSVVVPTYNMEAYLPRCLDSVTREDVPDTLEVIVVNDGSKDRSLEIAKEYQAKRPDIISIIDKPNGHYGSCINAALRVATGKYFRPLDADDWFDTDNLIKILHIMDKTSSDVIVTSFVKKTLKEDLLIRHPFIDFKNKTWTGSFNQWAKTSPESLCMHSMTYKKQILDDAKLNLQERICYTDLEYVIYPLSLVIEYTFLDIPLYHYDTTRDGQSMDCVVLLGNRNHLYNIILRYLSSENSIQHIGTRTTLLNILVTYYYLILFIAPKNKNDDNNLRQIDGLLSRKDKKLHKKLYIKLLGAPVLWKLFKMHFSFYEKGKKFFSKKK